MTEGGGASATRQRDANPRRRGVKSDPFTSLTVRFSTTISGSGIAPETAESVPMATPWESSVPDVAENAAIAMKSHNRTTRQNGEDSWRTPRTPT